MNHSYIPQAPSPGAASVLETCFRRGQHLRRFIQSGTIYYRQLDGTWENHRPAPCYLDHKRKLLAAVIDRMAQFHQVKAPSLCQTP